MQIIFIHGINSNPGPDEVGKVKLILTVFDEFDSDTFSTSLLVRDFINDETNECENKDQLNEFLDAGLSTDDSAYVMKTLVEFVKSCSEEPEYSPRFSLEIRAEIDPDIDPNDDEDDDDDDDDEDVEIEEALQQSLDETNTGPRPANRDVVESLPREIHNRQIHKEEECSVCKEEFNNGRMVVTLPCGHNFDEDCIMTWLETSSFCPLCRYQLPDE